MNFLAHLHLAHLAG
ncbi:hypothetical protein, partial [Pseudescherichia vulneris]